MEDFRRNLLILIVSRLILTGIVVAAALEMPQRDSFVFPYLTHFTVLVCALSTVYLILWRFSRRLLLLYHLQLYSDLVLVSLLVFGSGGAGSSFSILYVLLIVYASLLKQREGGRPALVLSTLSYVGIAHLDYAGLTPGSSGSANYAQLLFQVSTNVLAFASVALLGTFLSNRIQRAHRELGAARELYENIFNSMRGGLLTLDSEGRITSLNHAAREILGCSRQASRGKLLSSLFPDSLLSEVLKNDFEKSSQPLRMQTWVRTQKGNRIYLGMSCSPLLTEEGDRIGFVIAFQDLTAIKNREEALQLKEKMAAIGQVSADLAHEIRNPLGSLYGSIQLLDSELELSTEQKRLVGITLRECERLNKTVADFLFYAGPQPLSPSPVDLKALVEDSMPLIRNSPDFRSEHRIELDAPDEPIFCKADPNQLQQVVWNVVSNAMRAMPFGGRLQITIRSDGAESVLCFRDEGVGMTEEDRSKLFQPFHSGFRKGVGLGMAIVYQIVERHQGSIELESGPGRGTSVAIRLPAAEVPERVNVAYAARL